MQEKENIVLTPLEALFEKQRSSFNQAASEDWSERKKRLQTLKRVIRKSRLELAQAVSEDIRGRRPEETLLCEVMSVVSEISLMLKKAKGWSKREAVSTPVKFFPAKSYTEPRPRGVVGIIGAWNYPIALTLIPAIDAIAAGNRVMIKLPERSPATAAALERIINEAFDEAEVHAIAGDAALAKNFSKLPFDLLVFTGSSAVGREVMREASGNLTPVILELGGKSEVLIAPWVDLREATRRLLVGKLLNAGQTCIAPDVVRVNHEELEAFLETLKENARKLSPKSEDQVALIDTRAGDRIAALLKDAKDRGARVETVLPADSEDTLRMGLTALIDVPEAARISKEEIFGPLLIIKTYKDIEAEIQSLRELKEKPLALYVFDRDTKRAERIARTVPAGGVTINDTLLHFAQNQLPFGGVGESGMGVYHGRAGFEAFSHRVPVFKQSRFSTFGLFDPPYSVFAKALIRILSR